MCERLARKYQVLLVADPSKTECDIRFDPFHALHRSNGVVLVGVVKVVLTMSLNVHQQLLTFLCLTIKSDFDSLTLSQWRELGVMKVVRDDGLLNAD